MKIKSIINRILPITFLSLAMFSANALATECYHPEMYPASTADPTCVNEGYYSMMCITCGYTEYYSVAAKGHIYDGYGNCIVCGAASTAAPVTEPVVTYTPAAETVSTSETCYHYYPYWTTIQEATCTTAGIIQATCSYCGYTAQDYTDYSGHSYDAGKVITTASCAHEGITRYTCTNCGTTYDETTGTQGEHTYGEWETEKEATNSSFGKQTATCSVCGTTKTEDIVPKYTIQQGAEGFEVLVLQELLTFYKYLDDEQADGKFGNITLSALKTFQSEAMIEDNGIAFPQTIDLLMQKLCNRMIEKEKTDVKLRSLYVNRSEYTDKNGKLRTRLTFTKDKETYKWTIRNYK